MLLHHLDLRMVLQTVKAWRRPALAMAQCQEELLTEQRHYHFPMEPTSDVSLRKYLQEPTQAWHGLSNRVATPSQDGDGYANEAVS